MTNFIDNNQSASIFPIEWKKQAQHALKIAKEMEAKCKFRKIIINSKTIKFVKIKENEK